LDGYSRNALCALNLTSTFLFFNVNVDIKQVSHTCTTGNSLIPTFTSTRRTCTVFRITWLVDTVAISRTVISKCSRSTCYKNQMLFYAYCLCLWYVWILIYIRIVIEEYIDWYKTEEVTWNASEQFFNIVKFILCSIWNRNKILFYTCITLHQLSRLPSRLTCSCICTHTMFPVTWI